MTSEKCPIGSQGSWCYTQKRSEMISQTGWGKGAPVTCNMLGTNKRTGITTTQNIESRLCQMCKQISIAFTAVSLKQGPELLWLDMCLPRYCQHLAKNLSLCFSVKDNKKWTAESWSNGKLWCRVGISSPALLVQKANCFLASRLVRSVVYLLWLQICTYLCILLN